MLLAKVAGNILYYNDTTVTQPGDILLPGVGEQHRRGGPEERHHGRYAELASKHACDQYHRADGIRSSRRRSVEVAWDMSDSGSGVAYLRGPS